MELPILSPEKSTMASVICDLVQQYGDALSDLQRRNKSNDGVRKQYRATLPRYASTPEDGELFVVTHLEDTMKNIAAQLSTIEEINEYIVVKSVKGVHAVVHMHTKNIWRGKKVAIPTNLSKDGHDRVLAAVFGARCLKNLPQARVELVPAGASSSSTSSASAVPAPGGAGAGAPPFVPAGASSSSTSSASAVPAPGGAGAPPFVAAGASSSSTSSASAVPAPGGAGAPPFVAAGASSSSTSSASAVPAPRGARAPPSPAPGGVPGAHDPAATLGVSARKN